MLLLSAKDFIERRRTAGKYTKRDLTKEVLEQENKAPVSREIWEKAGQERRDKVGYTGAAAAHIFSLFFKSGVDKLVYSR